MQSNWRSLQDVKAAGPVVNIETLPTAAVTERAALLIAEELRAQIASTGKACLGIPGGSALLPLSLLRRRLADAWKHVWLTWVDERCVDLANPDSNRGEAYRSGALDVSDPPGLELALWLDNEGWQKATSRVELSLRQDFANTLDVALLGMGPDGHIASLFPGHRLMQGESGRVVEHLDDSPKPPPQRITLSLGFLKKTRHSYLVALGESKRDALQRVLGGDLELPLSHLDNLTILTDIDLGATS